MGIDAPEGPFRGDPGTVPGLENGAGMRPGDGAPDLSVFIRVLNLSAFVRGRGDPPFFCAAPPESNKTVLHVLSDSFKTVFVFLSCRFYLAGII